MQIRTELLDLPETRALLSQAMVQAVDDWRAHTGAPRPAVMGERLFGWLADMIIQRGKDPSTSEHGRR